MYFSFIKITLKGLYNILTHIAAFHIKIAAIFNNKIKLGVKGRAKTFAVLKDNITIAKNEYEPVLTMVQQSVKKVEALEKKLAITPSPYTPGRNSEWKEE